MAAVRIELSTGAATLNSPASLESFQPGTESPGEKKRLLEGFPQTSDFIAKDPAKATVIFRRFDQLAVRNLLHLEARLAALEGLQEAYDRDDVDFNKDNEPIATAARSWEDFAAIATAARSQGDSAATGTLRYHKGSSLPESVLVHWRSRRAENVAEYIKSAHEKKRVINTTWQTTDDIIDASFQEEHDAVSTTFELEKKAAAEARFLYNNPLGCGPSSLALIRSRFELAMAIEASLKEYQDAVMRYREMLKLQTPAERTKSVISGWIAGIGPQTEDGEPITTIMNKWLKKKALEFRQALRKSREKKDSNVKIQFLPGSSMHNIYAQGPSPDLVGVGRIAGFDPLTRWVSTWRLLYLFKDKHFGYPEIDYVPEDVIHITVTLLTVILAVVMVIGGIWGLYYLRTGQSHFYGVLILLSALIVLFAILMKLITTASRTELFGATAGYAAVLVVFVAFQAPNDQSFKLVFNNGTSGNGTISG